MLECNVVVPDALARKAMLGRAVFNVAGNQLVYHALLFLVIWVTVAIVDTMHDQGALISEHGTGLLLVLPAVVLVNTSRWYLSNRTKFKGGSYTLKADREGLTGIIPDQEMPWHRCIHYREHADYMLLVMWPSRRLVLPKTESLAAILQTIRENVPER